LGYQQIHLYGVSYGTRAALTYLRLYPSRVRSVVLDSVVSPELVLQLQMPRDAQRSLDLLFERCAQDADCSSQFPDFEREFYALRDQAGQGVQVSLMHPTTGELVELMLDQEGFMQMFFNLLYSTEITPLLPLMVHQVHESGDFGPLVAQFILLNSGEMYVGMFYAVTCSEDAAFLSLEKAEEYLQGSIFPFQVAEFVENCRSWPLADVSANFRTVPVVDVPVLLLSGDADPVTPPYYAEQVSSDLPNSLHLVLPYFGHGQLTNVCALQIMADFFDNPDLAALDTACVTEVAPMPFFMSLTGPRP
jgi:pimeloyl-ACP methyl ester carboxylesterase